MFSIYFFGVYTKPLICWSFAGEAKPLTIMETAPLLVELSPSPKSTKKPKTSSSEVSKVSEQKQRIASTVRDDDRECPTCHRMIRPENYGAHINSHSTGLKIVKIICHNCDTIFESYLELNAHYESQHTEFDPEMKRMKYFCSRCDTSYVKLSKLRIHLTHKHNRPPARIFECRACGITFTAMHEINDHIKVHTTCDICSEVCRSEVALRVHMLSHGDDEHPFECFVCHSTFGKINFLRIHTKYAHAVDVFRCTQCNAEFDRRQKLQVHRRTHHNGDVLRCEVCDRLLDQLGDYEEHLRVHPQCDLCGKRLKTKLQVWRHRLSHIAVEPFECYECHHRCRSFVQLKKHSHKHHTEAAIRRKLTTNPPKEHLCAQCGACFVKAMLLRKHLMREDHRKAGVGIDKPFECDVCQKRFSKSTSLKEHYRHHTGEKPYACEFCDKRFRSTTGLGRYSLAHIRGRLTSNNPSHNSFSSFNSIPLFFCRWTSTGRTPATRSIQVPILRFQMLQEQWNEKAYEEACSYLKHKIEWKNMSK